MELEEFLDNQELEIESYDEDLKQYLDLDLRLKQKIDKDKSEYTIELTVPGTPLNNADHCQCIVLLSRKQYKC